MTSRASSDVTRLLHEWNAGSPEALERLMDRVYLDLRKIAQNHFRRERKDHTLQPTALVNELFVKLRDQDRVEWQNRSQFYALASRIMRRLLIDYARERGREKRRRIQVTLNEDAAVSAGPVVDLLALDVALRKLESDHPRESQVVELRYFGGLTHEEVAEQLGVSVITVKRDWRFARTWLMREIEKADDRGDAG